MPDRLDMLNALRFGDDVAEHDQDLDAYFLKTHSYWAVVQDEADVILGPKGSGKSAVARYLSTTTAATDELIDTDVIPAFNVSGSVLFRRLSQFESPSDESHFRDVFLAYMVSLCANHLVAQYPQAASSFILLQNLHRFGLYIEKPSLQDVWQNVLSNFAPKVDQVGAANRARLDELEGLIKDVYDVLNEVDKRCWIIFDRLDEAFQERDRERAALRGLLAAHLDLCSFGPRIKAKMFLRLDVLDRITSERGFVNASHLRTYRILWRADAIVNMISLRIGASGAANFIQPRTGMSVIKYILPRWMNGAKGVNWLLLASRDASRELNPRNVLYLLRTARIEEMQIAQDDRPKFPLLGQKALNSGHRQLSIARLQDTLLAENAELRLYIERLKGGRRARFTEAELLEALDLQPGEFDRVRSELIYAGVLTQEQREYTIPWLLRPAMLTGDAHLTMSQADELEVHMAASEPGNDVVRLAADPSEDVGRSPRRRRRRGGRRRRGSVDDIADAEVVESIGSRLDDLARSRGSEGDLGGVQGDDGALDLSEPNPERVGGDSLAGSLLDASDQPGLSVVANQPSEKTRSTSSNRRRGRSRADADGSARATPRRNAEAHAASAAAMQAAQDGEFERAYEFLFPEYMHLPGIACLAADLAYCSGSRALLLQVDNWLAHHAKDGVAAALGRRVGVLIQLDAKDLDIAGAYRKVSRADGTSAQIGLIKMVGMSPSTEALFWRNSISRTLQLAIRGSLGYLYPYMPILAASRILPIYRFGREVSPDAAPSIRSIVHYVFPDRWLSHVVPRLEGYLHSYGAAIDSARVSLAPYQVVSVAAVLESMGRLTGSLREKVTQGLSLQLARLNVEQLGHFRAWSEFSSLASEATSLALYQDEALGITPKGTFAARMHSAQTAEARANLTFSLPSTKESMDSIDGAMPPLDVSIREGVMAIRAMLSTAEAPVVGAKVAQAALSAAPALGGDWAGSQSFFQFLADYVPELRHVSHPSPGYVFDPQRHEISDIPQALSDISNLLQ